MIEAYKAILRGDRLEWSGDAPEQINSEQGVEVYVIFSESAVVSPRVASDGKAMAEALEKIASGGGVSEISDPSEWQREQRQDRSLPGRDA